jgi:hypothetical protein
MRSLTILCGLALALDAAGAPATAQPSDSTPLVAAQAAAMKRLSAMDGEWRGQAVTQTPSGTHRVVHTERIGTLLGGSIRLVEGHAYNPDGSTGFNAFGMISFDPATGKYLLTSHALGRMGQFDLTPTADGYVWQIPAGPMTIKYTARIRNGTWVETGERIMPGKPPVQFFRMDLKRIGDSNWPAAGAVGMR